MRITNHFTDGTTRTSTEGVKVPYTTDTANAYATVQRVTAQASKERSPR